MAYSQQMEDEIVKALLGDRYAEGGTIWEIGAWHPEALSNSKMFIDDGWRAVLVEPSPGPLRDLVKVHGNNDRVAIVAAAVGFTRGLLRMDISDDALSTADAGSLEKWREKGGFFGRLLVPTITLEDLGNQFGGATVVSIDTEGNSVDIAIELLRLGQRPHVAIVEHDSRIVELSQVWEAAGYRVAKTNDTNLIFTNL